MRMLTILFILASCRHTKEITFVAKYQDFNQKIDSMYANHGYKFVYGEDQDSNIKITMKK